MKTTINPTQLLGSLFLLGAMLAFVGCDQAPTESDSTAHAEHDHDEHAGHDHDAHAGHDHDGHAGHDHDDHAGHDHDGHADHDDDAPESFAEALTSITSMKSNICKAFANKTPDDAHDELHEVGHLLEEMPSLAAKVEGISKEQLAKVEAAVEELFDGFSELDGTLHGGADVDVAALEKQLTDAIGALEAVTK
ncbi:MAG: hypothetical protein AAGG44_18595 [Planctomycetota bacterium]